MTPWLTVCVLAAVGLLLPPGAGARTCHLLPMTVVGSTGTAGATVIDFGAANRPQRPTAWQGPLRIKVGGAPACAVSDAVAIVEAPVLMGDGILYVPTYSGSNNRLYAVDARTCRVLWHSANFNGSTQFTHGVLHIGGKAVRLGHHCFPRPFEHDA